MLLAGLPVRQQPGAWLLVLLALELGVEIGQQQPAAVLQLGQKLLLLVLAVLLQPLLSEQLVPPLLAVVLQPLLGAQLLLSGL